jgi:hypothetical protein
MRSQLHLAVLLGRADWVRGLLASKVDVNVVDDKYGASPLMYAAAMGREDIVEMLLAAGAELDLTDHIGMTALRFALRNNHNEIATRLQNAGSAAERLKQQEDGPDGSETWIWIDQICINQADAEERGKQVSLMGDIYEGGFWTFIWLGSEDKYTQTAVETIIKLDAAKAKLSTSKILPYDEEAKGVYEAANIPYVSPAEWTSLAALFQRQYFRRLWVVQENVLSRVTLGQCGHVEVPWTALCNLAQQLHYRQMALGRATSARFIDNREAALAIESRAAQLFQWRDWWLHGEKANFPKSPTLEALVTDMWTFHASDPRDKIYGFYGLLNSHQRRKETGETRNDLESGSWVADYTKSTAQVYAEGAKMMLKEAGQLRFLSDVIDRSLEKTPGLPSWTPDFGVPFSPALPERGPPVHLLPELSLTGTPWNQLPILACPVDSLVATGTTTSGPGDISVFFSPFWLRLALLLPTPYHDTGFSRTEALWRTLIADTGLSGQQPAPDEYGDAFRDLIATMLCRTAREEAKVFLRTPYEPENPPRLPESPVPNLEEGVNHVKEVFERPILAEMNRMALKRTFSEVGGVLQGESDAGVVWDLMRLHVLALSEIIDVKEAAPNEVFRDENKEEGMNAPIDEEINNEEDDTYAEGYDDEKSGKGVGQKDGSSDRDSTTEDQNGPMQLLDHDSRVGMKLFTPTLDYLNEFNSRTDWNRVDREGLKLLEGNTDFPFTLRQTLGRRRLFVTEKRYLGLGPAESKEGDTVAFVKGFAAPVVLRERRPLGETQAEGSSSQSEDGHGNKSEKKSE